MGGLGLMDELGHQDFYPNGGTDMPNCYFSIICDHMKAIAYYTESISKSTPCRFRPTTWAPKWDNYKKGIQTRDCRNMACPDMGYTASPIHDEGVFYLKTNKILSLLSRLTKTYKLKKQSGHFRSTMSAKLGKLTHDEPPMYLQRPSSGRSQDVTHVLARTFRDIFTRDLVEQETVKNLNK
ncbi:phospholipase A1 member A-like [Strongylocentrotus purpuratus]|uniref:Lipase domain-containing protein n=1 Tax=Strongylocentrotus purpuratus TaxID=7668 RepID=A0A7M7NDF8_STRPU|nr:phospholipase A1 member A-like [Strongylocentrotus purpuratus]